MEKGNHLIVAGGSAGAIQAFGRLLDGLSSGFAAPVVYVQHLSAAFRSRLADVYDLRTELEVHPVKERVRLRPGNVYVAPPDRHVRVVGEFLELSDDETYRFCPSINFLFESAAQSYRERVIGVLLSGCLDDGVEGLRTIFDRGGRSLVQSVEEAEYSSMPLHAILRDHPDAVVSVEEMPALLEQMIRTESPKAETAD